MKSGSEPVVSKCGQGWPGWATVPPLILIYIWKQAYFSFLNSEKKFYMEALTKYKIFPDALYIFSQHNSSI